MELDASWHKLNIQFEFGTILQIAKPFYFHFQILGKN
jgi:hypothetical protein